MREVQLDAGPCLTIHEDHSAENDAGVVIWDAALVLAHYLQAPHVAGKRVLELGCGPGACGLAAAALGAASVTCTDLPHLLPLVRRNIEANGLERVATAVALEWGSPLGSDAPPELRPPFDLVLASDVLYLAEALPLFVSTLRQLSGPETLTLLCNERRPALPFPWALFRRAGFEVRQVPLGEQHPDWRSEDIELFRIQLSSSGGDSSSGGTDQEAA